MCADSITGSKKSTLCSFCCYKSARRFSAASVRGLMINRVKNKKNKSSKKNIYIYLICAIDWDKDIIPTKC